MYSLTVQITLAGFSPTTMWYGTDLVTIEPAATSEHSPIVNLCPCTNIGTIINNYLSK